MNYNKHAACVRKVNIPLHYMLQPLSPSKHVSGDRTILFIGYVFEVTCSIAVTRVTGE